MLTASAQAYRAAGLCVLPAVKKDKRPALSGWKQYQTALPTERQIETWFAAADALCIVCGGVSGRLEMIDFDDDGAVFGEWFARIDESSPELASKLVVERSPSGGRHVVYRHEGEPAGNAKLAVRRWEPADGTPIAARGKEVVPRRVGGRWIAEQTLIETRGEGGLFLCAPTPGYVLERGELASPPTLTATERQTLFQAAMQFDDRQEIPAEAPSVAQEAFAFLGDPSGRPGDDYCGRGDFPALLRSHGWTLAKDGENQQWRRPGKTDGASATWNGSVWFVFSSNAPPFEPQKGYSAFQAYALLEHDGDHSEAAAELRRLGFGESPTRACEGVDLSAFLASRPSPAEATLEASPTASAPPVKPKAEPFPAALLEVPGLIGDVVAHNLATAHRPQPVLALAAAISLQAVLAGRKIQDPRGNRTNVYVVGVAGSGQGKDHARKLNRNILYEAGLEGLEGSEDVASDAGLISCVEASPAVLLQIDEFGRLLRTVGDPRKAPHLYNVVTVLLKLFSATDTIYRGKAYGDSKRNKSIVQPCLSIYGTSVPEHFLESLTAESMQDGFVSRLLVFEAEGDVERKRPTMTPLPASIVSAVKEWGSFNPGGNLQSEYPCPLVVEYTPGAAQVFDDFAADVEKEMRSNVLARAIWSRAEEKACRLALVYAASACGPKDLVLGEDAAKWACTLSWRLTERILGLADKWVSDGRTDAVQKRVLRIVSEAGGSMTKSDLARKTQWLGKREREEIVANLLETSQMVAERVETATRPATVYRVVASG